MAITVTHITKSYGKRKALDAVSFTVPRGKVVGFLGPNGAGKSTTMKILTGYITADSGSVHIDGYDIGTHRKKVQQHIGYLPEHNPLYPEMYVREFLGFHAEMYRIGKKSIDHSIDLTGLTPEAHKKTGQLSKGYRQRLGLAAALLHDPEVLILDEPTTGLDPNQLVEIRQLIKRIGMKKTVLLSTHILQEVEAMCDRVLIMNKGKLVADTSLEALQNDAGQIIVVEFDCRVEAPFPEQLPQLNTVKNIDGFGYELTFNTQKDMRPAVFDFAHDNGLKIVRLNRVHTHLERLFRELTAT